MGPAEWRQAVVARATRSPRGISHYFRPPSPHSRPTRSSTEHGRSLLPASASCDKP